MATNYTSKAKAAIDPLYDTQINQSNQQYDKRVQAQNLQNTLSKNNYSNTTLGRGLGRSTITTSGLAGMDDANSKAVGNINSDRAMAIQGINSERSAKIQGLAEQYKQYDDEQAFKQQQLNFQKQQASQQLALQREQLAMQRANASRSRSSEPSYAQQIAQAKAAQDAQRTKDKNDIYNEFYGQLNATDQERWLADYRSQIINSLGPEEYMKLQNQIGKGTVYNQSVPAYIGGNYK